jgi:hypothetical protein
MCRGARRTKLNEFTSEVARTMCVGALNRCPGVATPISVRIFKERMLEYSEREI